MEFDDLIRLVIGALEREADALDLHGRGAEPAPAAAAPE
jgi:hypothetical protein